MGDFNFNYQQRQVNPNNLRNKVSRHLGLVIKADKANNRCDVILGTLNGQLCPNVPVKLYGDDTRWFPKASNPNGESIDPNSLVSVEKSEFGTIITGIWDGVSYYNISGTQGLGQDRLSDSMGSDPGGYANG